MPFDESLVARLRDALSKRRNLVEKRMFGGVAFFLNGNLLVGVMRDSLIVRLGPDQQVAALMEPHVTRFAPTGRPMTGWVVVGGAGLEEDTQLAEWIVKAYRFVRTLPAK